MSMIISLRLSPLIPSYVCSGLNKESILLLLLLLLASHGNHLRKNVQMMVSVQTFKGCARTTRTMVACV